MAADRVLQVRFVGNTSDLVGNIEGVSGKFGVLAKGVAAAGAAVGAGFLAAGKALFDIGATFDEVSDTIRVKTGKTGEELDKLNGIAKTVGTQVPADFATVGTAVAELSQRLGTTGKELGPLSVKFLELSRLTGTELSANIEGITRVFGDWSIKTEDQGKAMDKLFRASQATGIGIDRLSENVVKFGGPLRTMGFSFEQSLAMLGKFEKEGVNTELVMGSLRIALGKMAKAGKDPVTAFREVVTSIKNAGSAAEANKLALQTFGAKAGVDMALAIREGRFAIDDLVGTITNGSDTINKASLQTMDFAEQWQMFKNKAMVSLEPIANRVFGLIGEKMEALSGWFEENQDKVMAFAGILEAGFTVVFNVIGTVVDIFTSVGAALFPLIEKLTGGFTEAQGVVGPAIESITSKLRPLIDALGAFLAAILPIVEVLVAVLGPIVVSTFESIVSVISGALNIITGILNVFAGLLTGDWSRLWEGIKQIFSGLRDALVGLFELFLFGKIFTIVRRFIPGLGGLFTSAGRAVWDAITAAFKRVDDFMGGVPGRILGMLGNLGSLLWNVGRDIVMGLWRGISDGWGWLIGQVSGLAKRLFNAAKSALGISSPSKLFKEGVGRWIPEGVAVGIDANADSVRAAVQRMVDMARVQMSTRMGQITPLSNVVPRAALPAGAHGALDVALRVAGGADQAVATLIMELIRAGKIQLST